MNVQLKGIDWAFIIGYGVVAFGVGIYFAKRAGANIESFFVAGRKLPWWLAGTSIVATTFAADTPLAISGFIRKDGIYENWLWWNYAMAGLLCVFFYAKLWRRAGLITDVSFIELRYGGRPASVLRGFYAVYGGVLVNSIVMGWVMRAMMKVVEVMLGIHEDKHKAMVLAVLVALALGYTLLSGLWGVVMTDLIQFIIAMAGSFLLAGIVLVKMGGPVQMIAKVRATEAFQPKVLDLVHNPNHVPYLAMASFVILVSASWWGGGQGGGALAQRLFATKNERHSVLAALWFNFAHYVLRPWPWIIVGLASLVYFPITAGEDPELGYPRMMAEFLPEGLRGLMVVSFLAAFMSTMDTQMNFGASYLVNDLYKRFIRREASAGHFVMASRVACVVIAGFGALAAWQMETIKGAWVYLAVLGAGGGILGLLRWFWWRINAWAEITALTSSLIIANGYHIARFLAWLGLLSEKAMAPIKRFYVENPETGTDDMWIVRGFVVLVVCTVIWVIVTHVTPPVPAAHLEKFYRRVRPGGWWGPIAARCADVKSDGGLGFRWLGWFTGVGCIYGGLFGVGNLCLGNTGAGLAFLGGAVVAGYFCLKAVDATTKATGADAVVDE